MGTILITIYDRVSLNSVPFFSDPSSESSLRTLSEIRYTLWTALAVFNYNLCPFPCPSELNQSGIQYQLWLTRSSCVLSHGRFWMRRWRLDSSSENRRIQGMLQISDIFQLVANITIPDRRGSLGVSYLRILYQAPLGLIYFKRVWEGGSSQNWPKCVSKKFKAGKGIEENIF